MMLLDAPFRSAACKGLTQLATIGLILGCLVNAQAGRIHANPHSPSLLEVDDRSLVSRADLIYQSPAELSVAGQPVGNGRMGTMIWTTPDAIQLRINRCDVFAAGRQSAGYHRKNGSTDYNGGCARVAIDVGGQPFAGGKSFEQRLGLYDAECTIDGEKLSVRCFVSSAADVMVLEVDDQRSAPEPIRVTVSLWRDPEVKTPDTNMGPHVARYAFGDQADRVLLVQKFTEKDYYCASAVSARVVGSAATIEASDERSRTIMTSAKAGKTRIFISSAASFAPNDDVGAAALMLIDESAGQSYDVLRQVHTQWWAEFWSRTFMHIANPDVTADFMQRVRTLHLYYLASSSRGSLPCKFDGLLFTTGDDDSQWGSQYWVWTTIGHYYPLLAADAIDVAEPFFRMYVKQLPVARIAARQRWGVAAGAFYPETAPFDGPTTLPDEAAEDFQDYFLGRKPNGEVSERTRRLCTFESQLRYALFVPIAGGRFCWISHIASSGSEIALFGWWRYRYTGDQQWMRDNVYPLLRETAEFYRHFARKGEDGRYHIHETNVHEDFWGVNDGIFDLAAIRGTVPLAILASEILGVDAQLRPHWKELLENLAPYAMGLDPASQALTGGVLADDVWSIGHLGKVVRPFNGDDFWISPVFPYEDWTLETRDASTDAIVKKILDLAPRHASIMHGDGSNTALRTPIARVRAGLGEDLPEMLRNYYTAFRPMLSNGFGLYEGYKPEYQIHTLQPLGVISTTLQDGALQSVSPRPGQPEILSVFPAWPRQWDTSYRLLARGGFLVTSSMRSGEVEFVEIESRVGEPCRLRNPWDGPCQISEAGGATKVLEGEILRFDTEPGKHYLVSRQGSPQPTRRRISLGATTEPISFTRKVPAASYDKHDGQTPYVVESDVPGGVIEYSLGRRR